MGHTAQQHLFSQIPTADIPRSSFNRSHGHKTTFDSGYLVPFYIDEALPGDTFNLKHNIFARLATPIAPFMDNCYLDVFYFAVPLRLVWDNFKKFMGEQVNPADSTSYLVPNITCPGGGWAVGTLSDYFGLPTGIASVTGVSSLWHRAYNLIWNEWFRDENLQNSVSVPKTDGPDLDSTFTLLRRGKRHDYFTSCLPWPQKGPGVNLPLGTSAPVYGNGKTLGVNNGGTNAGLVQSTTGAVGTTNGMYGVTAGTNAGSFSSYGSVLSLGAVVKPYESGLYADLSTATAATINSLRQAFALQRLQERDARGGTRYTEIVRSHFGVVSPDARLQRPEYLGGSSTRVHINPVQQTSSTDGVTPQGNLAAFGVAADCSNGFTKSFTEHCVIIGLVNVRADLTYQQGTPKMFLRSTRWDFYWPALSHIGEQAVTNKEIYTQGNANDDLVFGYQERFAEYRYYPSKITGKFRSTYATPLDSWHLAQKFTTCPTLSDTFIQDNPPFARVIAVPSQPQFLFDSFIELQCARPMPVYGVPGQTDHF